MINFSEHLWYPSAKQKYYLHGEVSVQSLRRSNNNIHLFFNIAAIWQTIQSIPPDEGGVSPLNCEITEFILAVCCSMTRH